MTCGERDTPAPVLTLAEVDSTNAEAFRRAAAGERGPLWIIAERQTAGRGRSGRSWSQPEGNLAASLMVSLRSPASRVHQLSLLAGVAVYDAICAAVPSPPGLQLKWPNDVLIGRAKTGGILVEASTWAGETVAVVGIGINIMHAPEVSGREVTCLAAFSPCPPAAALVTALDHAMGRWLAAWRNGDGFAAVRAAWLARGTAAGEPLTVNTGGESLSGTFDGLDDNGALLLRCGNGTVRRLTYGDVSLPASPPPSPRGSST